MFHKPEDVVGLNIVGSYFDLGDRARENEIIQMESYLESSSYDSLL